MPARLAACVRSALVFGALVAQVGAADPPPKPARLDAFGDPLPEWAVARLGTTRLNHGDGPSRLYATPDGKTVVSVAKGTARVWDAVTGVERLSFSIEKVEWDEQATVTPDGKALVFLGQRFQTDLVRVYDLTTGKEARRADLKSRRTELSVYRRNALSPDGSRAFILTPARAQVYKTDTGEVLCTLPKVGKDVRGGTFAGRDRVVTVDTERRIEVWEAVTGKPVRTIPSDTPTGAVIGSPDGRLLAVVEHNMDDVDGKFEKDAIHVRDVETGARKHSLVVAPGRWFCGVSFSGDNRYLAATARRRGDVEATVWDLAAGKQAFAIPNATGQAPLLSPDGSRLFLGSEAWDVPSGRRLLPTGDRPAQVADVSLSPAGDRVVCLGNVSSGVWDGTTGRLVRKLDVPAFASLFPRRAFSPDGRYAASFEGDFQHPRLIVWDVQANRQQLAIEDANTPTAFSPDSAVLATLAPGKERFVQLRGLTDGSVVRTFKTPAPRGARQMAFSADGETLVTVGEKIARFDVATGAETASWVLTLPDDERPTRGVAGRNTITPQIAAVSPDGGLVAFRLAWGFGESTRDRLVLCDGRTGKLLRRWDDDRLPDGGWGAMTFSPDGRQLATPDGPNVHLWDLATGRKLRTFRGHRGSLGALAFSANGRRLASGSLDGTVLVWDLSFPSPAKADPAAWWADLNSDDAVKAWAAVWHLADAPDDVSLPIFREHLKPTTADDVVKVRQAIRDLDSDRFAIREKAAAELTNLGHAAGPALRAALDGKPSAEVRQRIEGMLEKIVGPPGSGESLRAGRALAALERKGTPAAKRLLKELATGADGAWLTAEARAAIRRVERRP